MKAFCDLFSNPVLWIALIAWILAQIGKVLVVWITEKRIYAERLFGDGGMPSGHAATVCALSVGVGYVTGLDSAAFAISVILAIIVMHDATGVRRETGKQALTILDIINTLNGMAKEKDPFVQKERLKVLVGHSPIQVFFGALLGLIVATVYLLVVHPESVYF